MISLPFDTASTAFFEDNTSPVITKIVHSHSNPHWFFNYHLHEDLCELVYINKGRGTYTIDNVPYHLKQNDLIIVNPRALHAVYSDHQDPLDAYNCSITGFRIPGLPDNHIIAPDLCPLLHLEHSCDFIQSTAAQILYQREQKPASCSYMCNLLASALVILTYQLFSGAPKLPQFSKDTHAALAHDVLLYISRHYKEPVTLDSLSRHFHISQGVISHALSSQYQISPINHLITCRLTASFGLLLYTDKTISAVSKEVGYDNPRHFTNLFLKRVGIHPLSFRASYREQEEH